jgi:S-layer protein (TIGR01567 family)
MWMRTTILIGIIGSISLLTIMLPACALDEVRSDIFNLSQKEVTLNGITFSGFYYDIDDNIVTENLTLRLSNIDPNYASAILSDQPDANGNRGLVYITKAQPRDFEFYPWGEYEVIRFFGESYFAAYDAEKESTDETDQLAPVLYDSSVDRNMMADEQICKILMNDDEEQTISSSQPLMLEEGYKLAVKAMDNDGKKIHLELFKDDEVIDSKVIKVSPENVNIMDETYYYKKDVGNTDDIVIIGVHFKNGFGGSDQNFVTIDGVWQISETPLSIKKDTKYAKMSIRDVNSTSLIIRMDNKDNDITLNEDEIIQLTGSIYIYTAEQYDISSANPLRYYIYKER